MTAHLSKHKSKKKINKPTLFIFYLLLYFDKFKIAVYNSYVIRKIRNCIHRIQDNIHWYLKHPDLYFEDKWETNECYPFKQNKMNQFTIKIRDRWFYPVTIVFLVATIFGIVRAYAPKPLNDILIHLIILVTGITSLILWKKQFLIIDQEAEEYIITWYNTTLFTQPIHNIFLRIHEISKSPADPSYYQLVIQATKLPPVSLTRLSADEERIRRIGHILSDKININFFEFEDLSHNHIIRHWPVLPPDDETNISPPPKTDFFQMKSMRAIFQAGSGLAMKSFYEFEKIVTGSQLTRKGSKQISSTSSNVTTRSSLKDSVSDRKFSWKNKPLSFFKKIFPATRRKLSRPTPDVVYTTESNLDRPGTSYNPHARFSDGVAPSLTKRVPEKSFSSADAFNQRLFLRELQRKIQSAQAESSEESNSLSSLSEVSITTISSENDNHNEKSTEQV